MSVRHVQISVQAASGGRRAEAEAAPRNYVKPASPHVCLLEKSKATYTIRSLSTFLGEKHAQRREQTDQKKLIQLLYEDPPLNPL
ncbi:unnamed protein product [Leptidea sinapis]|uniref:Uncharacterized protein n=1 Tax=Leptidea sinapis TaxID=189913 RepID=A0A5E4QFY2_9NEOP|nr:unnamed protein product [Leptidea sinapis]